MENTKQTDPPVEVESILMRSRAAFLRDLPALVANPMYEHWFAAYLGDQRIGIGKTESEMIQECRRRGVQLEDCFVGCVTLPSDEEEVDGAFSFVEYDDDTGTFHGPATE